MAVAPFHADLTAPAQASGLSRRRFLAATAGVAAIAAACGTSTPSPIRSARTPRGDNRHSLPSTESGVFYSKARHRKVGWTISYPPNLHSHAGLPLIVALHPYMGSHSYPMGGIPPAGLLRMRPGGKAIPPVAVAAVDGGNAYWHKHPGDDPMSMLLHEFLPMCRQRDLGAGARIGVIGASMGGYGSLLLAEQHRRLVAVVAVVSPAIWLTYEDSQLANPTAFTSAVDFAEHDVVRLAPRLSHTPVWVASGAEDPFHPGVEALSAALPSAHVDYPSGGHDDTFFRAHAASALRFAATHLVEEIS